MMQFEIGKPVVPVFVGQMMAKLWVFRDSMEPKPGP